MQRERECPFELQNKGPPLLLSLPSFHPFTSETLKKAKVMYPPFLNKVKTHEILVSDCHHFRLSNPSFSHSLFFS